MPTRICYSDTIYYTYDPDNEGLDSETTDDNNITYSYDDNGALLQAIRDNDANIYYTYNLQGRMDLASEIESRPLRWFLQCFVSI